MARKALTPDEKIAEIARSSVSANATLARAVARLVRKMPEFGTALISEVLRVQDDPKRFIRMDNGGWFDAGGISALVVVQYLEKHIAAGANENEEHEDGLIPVELIRHDMQDIAADALKIVYEIAEARREATAALERLGKAANKLSLLLS